MKQNDKIYSMILDYKNKLLESKDIDKYYLSLLSFNRVYSSITGKNIFNKMKDCDELLIKEINEYEEKHNSIYEKNMSIFCDRDVRYLYDTIKSELNSVNVDYDITNKINSSEQLLLIRDFFKNINKKDLEIFDDIYLNDRIITYDSNENRMGVMVYDFVRDEPYVFIPNPSCDYYTCARQIHEVGHAIGIENINVKNKSSYYFNSPNVEVISQYYENKFYNYLIEKNICKEEGKKLKFDFFKMISYFLKDSLTTNNLANKAQDLKYALGAVMAMQLENGGNDAVKEFYNKQSEIYVPNLITNLEDDIKVLKKEINNIR